MGHNLDALGNALGHDEFALGHDDALEVQMKGHEQDMDVDGPAYHDLKRGKKYNLSPKILSFF